MFTKELALKIHKANVDKGFYENPQSSEMRVLLIKSEAFEAFEAQRKNKYVKEWEGIGNMIKPLQERQNHAVQFFIDHIKDTFEDEIADVAIRTLDSLGYEFRVKNPSFDINECFYYKLRPSEGIKKDNAIAILDSNISAINGFSADACDYLLSWCETVAAMYNFDLMMHVELKLAYNATRAHKHGKVF